MNSSASPTYWLVNLFFGAGVAPTGVLLESVALGLERSGLRVQVIAGRTRYNASTAGTVRRFAGRVHWIYCWAIDAKGFVGRLFSWLIFYLGVTAYAFSHRLPDTVLLMTTPPYLHLIFVVRNWFARRKARLVLWNQDTYPEILAAVGMARRESVGYRCLLALQRFGVSRVNDVVVLDRAMKAILESHGGRSVSIIPNGELETFPSTKREQVASSDSPHLLALRAQFRRLVLYTGNYGWGHNLGILLDWIREHPEQRDLFFLFVGGGEKWANLEQFIKEHQPHCMAVRGYVSKARVLELIAEADFGLVALERDCVGLMSPSKIHGYLMLGKPLIYIGPDGSNVADAISNYQCGFQVDERDAAGLEELLPRLAVEDYAALSQRAANAARNRYVESVGVRDMLALLQNRDS